MARTICTLDHTSHSAEAVSAAIKRCSRNGDELHFVGVVQPFTQAAGPAFGERVRRFGHLLSESVAAADETGATEIILAEPRGLFQSGANVVTVSRPQTERRQLALVA